MCHSCDLTPFLHPSLQGHFENKDEDGDIDDGTELCSLCVKSVKRHFGKIYYLPCIHLYCKNCILTYGLQQKHKVKSGFCIHINCLLCDATYKLKFNIEEFPSSNSSIASVKISRKRRKILHKRHKI